MNSKPIRIAVLKFSHETVTFLHPDTTLDDFIYEGSPARGEALLTSEPDSYIGGFVKVAREFDGVELVGIESPLFPKTGTGSGWITNEAFETFVGKMIAELKSGGKFDGVYLSVHGAMGARGIPRPEAELARRVREVVGRGCFIVGTFDPHGNEDEEFLRHADMAFTREVFPALRQLPAGRTRRAHAGPRHPRRLQAGDDDGEGADHLADGAAMDRRRAWMDLVQRALTWEARAPDVYVNVFFGFPWSDVPDVGMTHPGDDQRRRGPRATRRRRHGAIRPGAGARSC